MREAGHVVLGGFELQTDTDVVRYPGRHTDERGTLMWDRVTGLLSELTGPNPGHDGLPAPATEAAPPSLIGVFNNG